jgi:outer membrane protein assembly complex protein YaeT
MVTELLEGTYAIMMMVLRQRCLAFLCIILPFSFGAHVVPASAQPAAAQPAPDLEGRTIATIQFEPRVQPLSPLELNEILPVKIGEPLRMAAVRDAIKRLYETGRYTDIAVDAQPYNDQVLVIFVTKNSWFIGKVAAVGDIGEPPNPGQLANAASLDLGRPFEESMLEGAMERMKNLLKGNGYFEAAITPQVQYDAATQQAHVTFHVEPQGRARYGTPVLKGDLKAPEEKVISWANWRRWLIGTPKPITQTRTRRGLDDIRDEYQDDERLMARVQLESMEYDSENRRGIATLNIDAGPTIEVRTIGDKLSTGKLKKYVPIYEERTIDRDLLVEGARNLRDYYQSEGYFDAEIEFKESRVTNDRATIDYLINKGRRHKLKHVEITGHQYFRTETLRERMYMREASVLQFRHGRYSESIRRRDEEAIANLYRANGFRDVSVTSRIENSYQGKADELAVFLTVKEGPQWFVDSLQIDGIERLDKQSIVSRLSSIEGQPFSEFNVAVDRDMILQEYFTNGFPDASFTWNFAEEAGAAHRVRLRFVVTEGEQQFVRQVLVSGLETTRPRIVNRNLQLNPGDPLSPIDMSETQRRLYELGVFAKVDMAVQNPDGNTKRKYVLYQMEEARRNSITGGIGAEIARIGGSSSGPTPPSGSAGFSPRVSLDYTRFNFLGLGHSVGIRTRVSNLQRRGLFNYSAPRFRNVEGRNLTFTLMYDDSRDVNTFAAKRQEASIQMSQKLSKPTTALFRFSYRRVGVSNLRIDPLLVPLLSQPVRIGMLSGTLIQDRRDDPVDSRRGIYNTVDFGLASRYFGSQRGFIRGLARNSTYHPLTRNLVLARETSFGIIRAAGRIPADLENEPRANVIPFPERFFGGGGSSHRGFNENQAGPRDENTGFPVGGNALLFNKVELRFPLIGENIGGVLFHDAGNVYSNIGDISFRFRQPVTPVLDPATGTTRNRYGFDYMVHAVGVGLRYKTPIGPVRVDLAYSANSPRFFGCQGSYQELLQCASAHPPENLKPEEQRISRFQFFFSIGQTF